MGFFATRYASGNQLGSWKCAIVRIPDTKADGPAKAVMMRGPEMAGPGGGGGKGRGGGEWAVPTITVRRCLIITASVGRLKFLK